MNNDAFEESLQAIGRAIVETTGGNGEGAFLYAEAKPGMMSPSLFVDRGSYVECLMTSEALSEALFDSWEASEEGKEWAALRYTIDEGKFDARFQYPDELSEEEWIDDRRNRILSEKYGDRPIKYPPPPETAM